MAPARQRGLAAVAAAGSTSANLIEMGRPRLPSASLEAFCKDPRNHRRNMGDLADLAERMRKHGQLQPVVCVSATKYRTKFPDLAAEIPYGADYVVVMGNRRLKAAPLAGLETLTYTLSDHLLEKDDYREAALDENWRREDLTCLDDARLLAEFLEVDGTHKKVAERVGRSEGFVAQRLRLLTLAPEVQDAIDAKLIVFDQARQLCALEHAAQLERLEQLLAAHAEPDNDDDAQLPSQRRAGTSSRAPSVKSAGRWLGRFKDAHGPDVLGGLLRDGFDAAELTAVVSTAAQGLDAGQLDTLLDSLTQLREARESA